jgi:hypothetical protein
VTGPVDLYTTGIIAASCTLQFSATQTSATVTISGDTNETLGLTGAQSISVGATLSVQVDAIAEFTLNAVGGTCPAGSFGDGTTSPVDVYTTGVITTDCTLVFSASQTSATVTVSGDGNETLSLSGAQTVAEGGTLSVKVDAVDGTTLNPVGGTCAAGTFGDGITSPADLYTTGVITTDCTLVFTAPPP